jgi:2-keto-4-pentenoate hydratase/2-oxohepta-3-ene-1,7-dioic acid hydratase in catechol pathway
VRFVRVETEGRPQFGRWDGDTVALYDRDPLDGGVETGRVIPFNPAELGVPVAPTKIIGVGLNYRAHALEMKKPLPDEPLLFMKPLSALLPSGAPILRPRGWERTDFEGELGVVIGKRARRVTAAQALDYVFGYTIVNDVTVRDLQKKDVQYTRAKGFDSFCPVGPCVATELDPTALAIRTNLSGQPRQDGRTDDMIFPVAELVAFISRVMTLEPGDLITTGTPPGVGPISPGDTIEISIDGIGTLTNPVLEEEPLP